MQPKSRQGPLCHDPRCALSCILGCSPWYCAIKLLSLPATAGCGSGRWRPGTAAPTIASDSSSMHPCLAVRCAALPLPHALYTCVLHALPAGLNRLLDGTLILGDAVMVTATELSSERLPLEQLPALGGVAVASWVIAGASVTSTQCCVRPGPGPGPFCSFPSSHPLSCGCPVRNGWGEAAWRVPSALAEG